MRRYRDRESRPIPVWNGILEHRAKIRDSVWTYLWFLDKITQEDAGKGLVLGGAPVKVGQVAADLALDESSVRRDIKRLAGRYLEVTRTPYGLQVRVLNSRKFHVWGSGGNARSEGERSGKNAGQIGRKCLVRSGETSRNKEDAAVYAAVKQQQQAPNAAAANPPGNHTPTLEAWAAAGLDRPAGPAAFQRLWEAAYAERNGERLSVVMGRFLDDYQADGGGRIPRPFAQAIRRIRDREGDGDTDPGEGYARL